MITDWIFPVNPVGNLSDYFDISNSDFCLCLALNIHNHQNLVLGFVLSQTEHRLNFWFLFCWLTPALTAELSLSTSAVSGRCVFPPGRWAAGDPFLQIIQGLTQVSISILDPKEYKGKRVEVWHIIFLRDVSSSLNTCLNILKLYFFL